RSPSTPPLLLCAIGTVGCVNILGIDEDYHQVSENPLDAGGLLGDDGGSAPSCTVDGGVAWEQHCYFLLAAGATQAWSNAKSACAAFPSTHLVTISSAKEQTFLDSRFFTSKEDHWIGLALASTSQPPSSCTTNANSCPFSWVTGERVEYTNWTQRTGGPNEPNYTGACVRVLSAEKTWADTDCTTRLPALCETD
ncbi:MAG TPA: C-type lectin domain-containing protein, partial [Polyangiales bacterium]